MPGFGRGRLRLGYFEETVFDYLGLVELLVLPGNWLQICCWLAYVVVYILKRSFQASGKISILLKVTAVNSMNAGYPWRSVLG